VVLMLMPLSGEGDRVGWIRPYRPRIPGSPGQSPPIPPGSADPGPAGGVRETHEIPGALLPPWRSVWLEV